MKNPFKSIERQLNLTDKSFFFETEGKQKVKILASDVSDVKIAFQSGYIWYKKLKLKTVNNKEEIIDVNREVWLPVILKDSRINILGVTSYAIENDQYMGTYIYLNREEEGFAINPLDFNRISLFNMGKVDDKMEIALKETFRDCPATVELIEERFANKEKVGMKEA